MLSSGIVTHLIVVQIHDLRVTRGSPRLIEAIVLGQRVGHDSRDPARLTTLGVATINSTINLGALLLQAITQ